MIDYKEFVEHFVITEEEFNDIISNIPSVCLKDFDWDYFDDGFDCSYPDEAYDAIVDAILGIAEINKQEHTIELDKECYNYKDVNKIIREGWTVTNYSDFVDPETAKLMCKIQGKATPEQLKEFLKSL